MKERPKYCSVSAQIDDELSDQLDALHKRTRVPRSVYVREGIALVLERYSEVAAAPPPKRYVSPYHFRTRSKGAP